MRATTVRRLYEREVPALIADGLMRRRDERFAEQGRYKALPDPLYDKAAASKPSNAKFQPSDFVYDPATRSCICPAGKKLYCHRQSLLNPWPQASQVPGRQTQLRAL